MKFNKDKFCIWEGTTSDIIGAAQLETRSAEKELGAWWTPSRMWANNVPSEQRYLLMVCGIELGKILTADQKKCDPSSPLSTDEATHGIVSPFLGSCIVLSTGERWRYWRESSRRARKRQLRNSSISPKERLRKLGLFWGDLVSWEESTGSFQRFLKKQWPQS